MTSEQVYEGIIHGAYEVIRNKEVLNKINVFPVRDGDTGSNLTSMMRTIIHKSEKQATVKETLESVADAALYGARGNSGIIFAQYLTGLSETIDEGNITIKDYAKASNQAVKYAYEAVEKPVEGTMITIMKEWGGALISISEKNTSIDDIFSDAYLKILKALEKTKEQLLVLKKADVVDSGAKGFTCFIAGISNYIKNGSDLEAFDQDIEETEVKAFVDDINHSCSSRHRYCTECLVEGPSIDREAVKGHLASMGDSTVVAGNKRKCRVHIHTDDPSKVFDYIHTQGNIVFQKVDDMKRQENIVKNQKSKIAIVTDSIADLPKALIDEHQIHVIHLDIMYKDKVYMDKLTIRPEKLLELSKAGSTLPTSSQPSPKQIENTLDYLSTYYDYAIILTVSKALSGTYNNINKSVVNSKNRKLNVSVINTKQNSGAQGLLVLKAARYVALGMAYNEIVDKLKSHIELSKILVQVKTIDNMIKSGRLSVKAGKIAKFVGLKPIVTLDKDGSGALEGIAFSMKGSNKKLLSHIRGVNRDHKIGQYNLVHVNNLQGAKELGQVMSKLIGFDPEYISETSSIVAVGAGDGAIAISYILKEEEV